MNARRTVVAATVVLSMPLFIAGENALLQSVSGQQSITAAPKLADDLNTTVFQTPAGKISVNIPEDVAAGDTITGTVIAEPAPGQTPEETAQNQDELNGYVIEAKNAEQAPPEEPKPVTAVNPTQPPETQTPPSESTPAAPHAPKKHQKDPICDPHQRLMTMILPQAGIPVIFHIRKRPHHESGPLQDATASHNSGALVDAPPSYGSSPSKKPPQSHYSAPLVDQPQSLSPSSSTPSSHYSAPLVDPALAADAPAIHNSPSLASLPVSIPAKPPATSVPKGSVSLPQVGQPGHPISVKAPGCSGYPSDNSVMVGNQRCEPLAMGPRGTIVKSPNKIVGPSTISFQKGGKIAKAPFHNLAVKLSCPNPTLHKGETTTVTVTVSGLRGLTHPVKLRITNRTPNVVDLDGGNEQVITINPTGSDSQSMPMK